MWRYVWPGSGRKTDPPGVFSQHSHRLKNAHHLPSREGMRSFVRGQGLIRMRTCSGISPAYQKKAVRMTGLIAISLMISRLEMKEAGW